MNIVGLRTASRPAAATGSSPYNGFSFSQSPGNPTAKDSSGRQDAKNKKIRSHFPETFLWSLSFVSVVNLNCA